MTVAFSKNPRVCGERVRAHVRLSPMLGPSPLGGDQATLALFSLSRNRLNQ